MGDPSFNWITTNDPVMGGESYSSVEMMSTDGTAVFTGEVKDVPFLGLPGYIQMESRGGKGTYPDVSCCDSIKLNVMGTQEYAGFRLSFGTKRANSGFFAQGFKAGFNVPSGSAFGDVIIPFNMFSVEWDEATGDHIIACADDPDVCPDTGTLQDMQTIAIWGEGVGGKVYLHVNSISAVGCSSSTTPPAVSDPISGTSESPASLSAGSNATDDMNESQNSLSVDSTGIDDMRESRACKTGLPAITTMMFVALTIMFLTF